MYAPACPQAPKPAVKAAPKAVAKAAPAKKAPVESSSEEESSDEEVSYMIRLCLLPSGEPMFLLLCFCLIILNRLICFCAFQPL